MRHTYSTPFLVISVLHDDRISYILVIYEVVWYFYIIAGGVNWFSKHQNIECQGNRKIIYSKKYVQGMY